MWKFSSSLSLLRLNCYVWKNISIDSTWSSFFIYFCMWKKSVSTQSISIISHTFDEILEIYKKKYFQVAIQNLIIFFSFSFICSTLTRHINKYSVKRNERNVIFERKYLTNWISSSSFPKIYKNIKKCEWMNLFAHEQKKEEAEKSFHIWIAFIDILSHCTFIWQWESELCLGFKFNILSFFLVCNNSRQ